jgi:LytS/YehU family sensor histidine kinase
MDGDFQGQLIPPMIIIPLVENAFKHGAKGNTGKVLINIQLTVTTSGIVFLIENTMGKGEEAITEARGLGLQNVKRRLALLYPDQYVITTSIENGTFKALLELTA